MSNKLPLFGAAAMLCLVGVSAVAWSQLSPQAQLERAVAYNLIDPSSAEFRNVRRVEGDQGWCGEVNAKNRMGAYVGFNAFYANYSGDNAAGDRWNVAMVHDDQPAGTAFLTREIIRMGCER